MSQFHVQPISREPIDWGEAPHWDERRQLLYYVDCFGKAVYKLDPENDKCQCIAIPKHSTKAQMITVAVPTENSDEFVVTSGNSIVQFNAVSQETTPLGVIENGGTFNDGKCDTSGRFWVGTFKGDPSNVISMQKGAGGVYCLDNACNITQKAGGLSISNGITWSLDNKKMFVVDSMDRTINALDFDVDSQTLGNKKVFFQSNSNFSFHGTEIPDGITTDIRGNFWIVVYYGGKVLNIDSNTGQVINRIELPANMVTSACFGGPELNELFVTSSYRGLSNEQRVSQDAGHLFKVTCYRDNSFKGFGSNCFAHNR